jgi:hypothetical protein
MKGGANGEVDLMTIKRTTIETGVNGWKEESRRHQKKDNQIHV